MPEFSNIQTYVLVKECNYQEELNKYYSILENIGVETQDVRKRFNGFYWELDDDGYVHNQISSNLPFLISTLTPIPIRPHIPFYTTQSGIWMGLELLIETEKLQDLITRTYYQKPYILIKTLVYELHKQFQQTGVYFTDEAQDGQDFDGITEHDHTQLWNFDYAIIPNHLKTLYANCPATHQIKPHDKYFEAWYIGEGRWQNER